MYVQDAQVERLRARSSRPGGCAGRGSTRRRTTGPNGVAVAGRPRLRRDRHDRLRAEPAHRTPALEPPAHRSRTSSSSTSRRSSTGGRVYLSTVGFPPGGRGALYALDARTGASSGASTRSRDPWPHPIAGGGGAWNPVSVDGAGRVYAGISNPGAVGRARRRSRTAAAFRGRTLYTDSLVVLDGRTGAAALVRPGHASRRPRLRLPRLADPRAVPVAAPTLASSAPGKAGRVVAWDRATRRRLWTRAVGTHLNDLGPLPDAPRARLPGALRRRADADGLRAGTLFVPSVELCMRESAVHSRQRPPAAARRAEGRPVRARRRDGRRLAGRVASARRSSAARPSRATWSSRRRTTAASTRSPTRTAARSGRARAQAGINGCPAVAGDTLLVPRRCAAPRLHPSLRPALVAYRHARATYDSDTAEETKHP